MNRIAIASFCALFLGLAGVLPAAAQQYPDKAVKMIVAWPPGGGTDVVARIVAKHLSERLKQPVVVENRAGASGQVGSEYVARAPADGYTLQYTVADSHSINPHVYPKVRYDALKEFTPVAMTGSMPNALAVGINVPANTLAEFVKLAKEKPGRFSFSSWGMGSGGHIRMQSFTDFTNIELLHVPFQGSGPGFAAVLGGQVDAMMVPLGLAESNFKAGKIKILAVDSAQRYASVPEVPTFAEQGVPLSFSFWQGVLAPAKVPEPIINALNKAVTETITDPAVRAELLKVGMVAGTPGQNGVGVPPAEVRKYFEAEFVRWGKTIRDGNIKAE
jgi:tripartite-type tricarboxylate transporter receptor subunit TctC